MNEGVILLNTDLDKVSFFNKAAKKTLQMMINWNVFDDTSNQPKSKTNALDSPNHESLSREKQTEDEKNQEMMRTLIGIIVKKVDFKTPILPKKNTSMSQPKNNESADVSASQEYGKL